MNVRTAHTHIPDTAMRGNTKFSVHLPSGLTHQLKKSSHHTHLILPPHQSHPPTTPISPSHTPISPSHHTTPSHHTHLTLPPHQSHPPTTPISPSHHTNLTLLPHPSPPPTHPFHPPITPHPSHHTLLPHQSHPPTTPISPSHTPISPSNHTTPITPHPPTTPISPCQHTHHIFPPCSSHLWMLASVTSGAVLIACFLK